jgi:chloramphenicol 3-O-phosphotransferase
VADPKPALAERPRKTIRLNGASSSGNATAKELQNVAREPYLHVSLDVFLHQLPASFIEEGRSCE